MRSALFSILNLPILNKAVEPSIKATAFATDITVSKATSCNFLEAAKKEMTWKENEEEWGCWEVPASILTWGF